MPPILFLADCCVAAERILTTCRLNFDQGLLLTWPALDNYICFRVPFLLFINSEDHSDDSRSGFQASVVQNSERFWFLFRDGAQPLNGIRFSALFPRFDLSLGQMTVYTKLFTHPIGTAIEDSNSPRNASNVFSLRSLQTACCEENIPGNFIAA